MKKIAAILCGAVLATSAVCSATIAPDAIAVGRVVPGMSVSSLTSIYGQPNFKKGDDWTFRNFKVEVEKGKVQEIETTSDALATPAGVTVGQDARILTSAYGSADRIDVEGNEEEYEFYSHDYSRKIEFKVRSGFITKIICETRD